RRGTSSPRRVPSLVPVPALALLGLELRAIAGEEFAQLLAAGFRRGQRLRVVAEDRDKRLHRRDVVAAGTTGHPPAANKIDDERLENVAAGAQRRLERLALDQVDAARLELHVVIDVSRARDYP